ncbi:F5/8 type C domain-containing protein [Mobilisporobacter senegalensis]|uniref:F5/8 type C domain-containing protein n=1 Tax=Mobilisporobacter senegalensis TaxID=1329262 RepID=A0A3N1XZ02_9FIRM|nr:discoidin domain-containing protein [Mobilisporobacter senegalensis]ROR31823.1 F5/8 type C domain-containing protein [Mobilisporobacter senegalensis]
MEKRKIGILILIIINLGLFISILAVNHTMKLSVESGNVTMVHGPDQTEPMEHEKFAKEEYIPVIPEGENIALGKKVKASGFQDVYTPRKAVDGRVEGVSYWEGKGESYPNIITVDLEKEQNIHAIRLCLNPASVWGKRTQEFSVLTSMDGKEFKEIIPSASYDFNPDTGNQVILTLEDIKTRFVQLSFTMNTGAKGAQLAEFEVY